MNNTMSDAILNGVRRIHYELGVIETLEELRAVCGERIEQTNIWKQYMTKEITND